MSIKIVNPISSIEVIQGRDGISFLKKGDIQIWCLSLDADEQFKAACFKALGDKGQENVDYFKFPKVKESYIISQGGLRLLLAYYLTIAPEKIELGKLKKGKPFSVDNPKLRFNISNSGRKVVYAFSLDEEVGIDLEKLRELPDLGELIEKNFSLYEREYINKIPEQRQNRFFKFWTIKEAYLKAIGVGMRIPPEDLEFSVQNGEYKLQAIKGEVDLEDWIFENFFLEDNEYVGTLTIKNPTAHITLRSII